VTPRTVTEALLVETAGTTIGVCPASTLTLAPERETAAGKGRTCFGRGERRALACALAATGTRTSKRTVTAALALAEAFAPRWPIRKRALAEAALAAASGNRRTSRTFTFALALAEALTARRQYQLPLTEAAERETAATGSRIRVRGLTAALAAEEAPGAK
jgi:hypothetical protein